VVKNRFSREFLINGRSVAWIIRWDSGTPIMRRFAGLRVVCRV
jgi:hypothetical protein